MTAAKRLIIISISILILGYSIAWVAEKGRRSYSAQETEKLDETLKNDTYHEIIFLGSSRIQNHVSPKIVDSLLKVNSYNLGLECVRMNETAVLLKGYLENHAKNPPQKALLNIDYYALTLKEKLLHYPAQYFPYLNNKAMRAAFEAQEYYPLLYDAFPFLVFSEYDDGRKIASLQGLMGRKYYDKDMYKGSHLYEVEFSPVDVLEEKVNGKPKEKKAFVFVPKAKDALNEIISLCKQHNIQLIFVYSPYHKGYIDKKYDNERVLTIIDSTAKTHNIPFLRHDTLAMNQVEAYFRDFTHLNKKGALVYSARLAEDLKKLENK